MESLQTTEKTNGQVATKPTLQSLLTQDNVKRRFEEMLGKKAAGFISSIISATKSNPSLQKCEPNSIISAAVIAATLDLPIQNNLGFAAIVPYKDDAQFQMMWRGYVQLAMRTGQYLTINVSEVYEGELLSENRITGEYVFDTSKKSSDKIIGYVAYFKMVNGFFKYFYWTTAQVTAHAKKYSQTFKSDKKWVVESSRWTVDFDAMAKKTVLKLLLGRFGILSVDMQTALVADQGVIKDADTIDIDYVDNKQPEVNKEKERIELLLADCKTVEDVISLQAQCPEADVELFNKRRHELMDEKEIPQVGEEPSMDLLFNITLCDTMQSIKEFYDKCPEWHNNKTFNDAINTRKIEIGKALQKKTNR